jgi:hypothetical protein
MFDNFQFISDSYACDDDKLCKFIIIQGSEKNMKFQRTRSHTVNRRHKACLHDVRKFCDFRV